MSQLHNNTYLRLKLDIHLKINTASQHEEREQLFLENLALQYLKNFVP